MARMINLVQIEDSTSTAVEILESSGWTRESTDLWSKGERMATTLVAVCAEYTVAENYIRVREAQLSKTFKELMRTANRR